MVDERVAVALEAVDDLVAQALAFVGRILLVPFQDHREQAHVGLAGADQAGVVGEDEVGLGFAGDAVVAAFVADIHVHHGAGDVAAAAHPGFPDAAVEPVGVVAVAAAALAVVGHRGPLAAVAGAVIKVLVAAVGVVADVREHEHVRVGVGAALVVGEAQRIGPGVLAVVVVVAAIDLDVAVVAEHIQDAVGVGRILVGKLEDVPGVGLTGGVGVFLVVADHRVQGLAQDDGIVGDDAGVVIAVVGGDGEGPAVVGGHRRGRAVQVDDMGGEHGGGAVFQRCQVGVRIGDVLHRPAADRHLDSAGFIAVQLQPAGLGGDRLAEIDAQIHLR